MNLRIAGTVNDSIVDGPGIRFTIFTQGCPHRCKGCHNPQTHDLYGGKIVTIDNLIIQIQSNPLLDGVTFSGGEPFLQAESLAELGKYIHAHTSLNIVTYTGYTFEELLSVSNVDKACMRLLEESDILIDGLFIESEKSYELRFKGSSNQRCINVKDSLLQNKIVLANI